MLLRENYQQNIRLPLKGIRTISSIRKTNPLSYAHLIKSLQMLQSIGLYTESIE